MRIVQMLFKDEYDISLLPKTFFMTAIIGASLLAGYLMFVDEATIISWLKPYTIAGNSLRQVLLMFCLILYVSRLLITVFVFLKRKMSWLETILISALMSFALFSFARIGGSSHEPQNIFDFLGLMLFLFGSWINTYSEYTRYTWKKSIQNKGKLYTGGLFKYSMHINYFGDVILFIGLALMTQSFSLLIIPLVMALNFVFFLIPTLDKYLEKKYGDEFREYSGRTKKLIPGIY
jgi:protein-S-isoprenylcysteine O-methyltransferase Ste14